jgi:hypothetical protein
MLLIFLASCCWYYWTHVDISDCMCWYFWLHVVDISDFMLLIFLTACCWKYFKAPVILIHLASDMRVSYHKLDKMLTAVKFFKTEAIRDIFLYFWRQLIRLTNKYWSARWAFYASPLGEHEHRQHILKSEQYNDQHDKLTCGRNWPQILSRTGETSGIPFWRTYRANQCRCFLSPGLVDKIAETPTLLPYDHMNI